MCEERGTVSIHDLDALDRQMLASLQETAWLTNHEIAGQTGSSEPTVRRRIDRLLAAQVIKIVAVASPFALGPVVAILGLQIDCGDGSFAYPFYK